MKSKHWLTIFFVLFLVGTAGYMALNYYVDPLGYFTVKRGDTTYHNDDYTRVIKSEYVIKNADEIEAVVVGGSKAGALDTELLTEYTGKKYYNFYFNIGNFSDYYTYIEYLINNTNISEITLHLSSFEVSYTSASNSDTMKVPAIVSGNVWDQMIETCRYLLTNFSTLYNGYKQMNTRKVEELDQLENGEFNRLPNYKKFKKDPEAYTSKYVTKKFNKYLKSMFNQNASKNPAFDFNLEKLREIKSLCEENNVTLKVVIGASFIGERNAYECYRYYDYLHELVTITDVWDFSDFNDINMNPYNFVNRRHFNTAVGDLMINTMYGQESKEGFGIYLTKDNIDDYLKQRKSDFEALKQEFETTGTVKLLGMDDASYTPGVEIDS